MKCKKHPIDPSSNVGVCASCLRERIVAVIAAQVQAQREALFQQGQKFCRKSDAQLPPFVFPRPVSPYVSHRKSDSAATRQIQNPNRLFYSTPQVGPNGFVAVLVEKDKKSSGKGRFSSVLHGLLRSKSDKEGLDTGASVDSCATSSSWFSMILPRRRKKKIQTFSVEEYSSKAGRVSDRGMSPSNLEDDEHCRDVSSGYSSESSHGWKQTPRRTPATRRCKGRTTAHSRNASGLAFCLSPLVRPSPNRKWNQKVAPPDVIVAGEVRAPPKPKFSAAPSLCKNRSRKLADFGKQSGSPYPIP